MRSLITALCFLVPFSPAFATGTVDEEPSVPSGAAPVEDLRSFGIRLWAQDPEGKVLWEVATSSVIGAHANVTDAKVFGAVIPDASPIKDDEVETPASEVKPGMGVSEITVGYQVGITLQEIRDNRFLCDIAWSRETDTGTRTKFWIDRLTRNYSGKVAGPVGKPTEVTRITNDETKWVVFIQITPQ